MAVLGGSCEELKGFLHYLRLIIWRGKIYKELPIRLCDDNLLRFSYSPHLRVS